MWLHCNKCGILKSENKTTKFFVLLCSHVLCEECNLSEMCPIHKRRGKGIEINKAMPSKMLSCFEDPNTLLTSWQKCIRFQMEQRSLIENREWKQVKGKTEKLKEEIAVLNKFKAQAVTTIEKDSECIKKMKAYFKKLIEYYQSEEEDQSIGSPNNTGESSSSSNVSSNGSGSLAESGVDLNFDEFDDN